jgi:hypothetical protein
MERGFDLAHAQAVRLEGVVSGCPMPSVRGYDPVRK